MRGESGLGRTHVLVDFSLLAPPGPVLLDKGTHHCSLPGSHAVMKRVSEAKTLTQPFHSQKSHKLDARSPRCGDELRTETVSFRSEGHGQPCSKDRVTVSSQRDWRDLGLLQSSSTGQEPCLCELMA